MVKIAASSDSVTRVCAAFVVCLVVAVAMGLVIGDPGGPVKG